MSAIRATLEDFKRVKTRSTWQIILEIPEADILNAMQVLGNPLAGESIWVGVARLVDDKAATKTKLGDMSLPDPRGDNG